MKLNNKITTKSKKKNWQNAIKHAKNEIKTARKLFHDWRENDKPSNESVINSVGIIANTYKTHRRRRHQASAPVAVATNSKGFGHLARMHPSIVLRYMYVSCVPGHSMAIESLVIDVRNLNTQYKYDTRITGCYSNGVADGNKLSKNYHKSFHFSLN